jgi:prevent-host-death family protein
MTTVNMFEAKSSLSRLVDAVESGAESEIIIARNGKPAAKLVPIRAGRRPGKRIGLLKGKFTAPADLDADNAMIAKLFAG